MRTRRPPSAPANVSSLIPSGSGITAASIIAGGPPKGFGFPLWVVFWILLLGMVVGAIGSGTAASRFLDV